MRLASKLREFRDLFFRDARAGTETFCMHLQPQQQLRLSDAAGWVLESCGGTVWITQEGDASDVLLNTGERFTLDRDGKTLVSGLGAAIVMVRPPAQGSAIPQGQSTRTVWLDALYPHARAWKDPASLRRAGLI